MVLADESGEAKNFCCCTTFFIYGGANNFFQNGWRLYGNRYHHIMPKDQKVDVVPTREPVDDVIHVGLLALQ
jgi:hypothetical protein